VTVTDQEWNWNKVITMGDELIFSGENQLFKDCYLQYQGAIDDVLQCVTNGLDSRYSSLSSDTRSWLLILAGSMVFFMVRTQMRRSEPWRYRGSTQLCLLLLTVTVYSTIFTGRVRSPMMLQR
jgi:hypothetical protein